MLGELLLRVRATVDALFGHEYADSITRERNRVMREAAEERARFSAHWRTMQEADRYLRAFDRMRGDK